MFSFVCVYTDASTERKTLVDTPRNPPNTCAEGPIAPPCTVRNVKRLSTHRETLRIFAQKAPPPPMHAMLTLSCHAACVHGPFKDSHNGFCVGCATRGAQVPTNNWFCVSFHNDFLRRVLVQVPDKYPPDRAKVLLFVSNMLTGYLCPAGFY